MIFARSNLLQLYFFGSWFGYPMMKLLGWVMCYWVFSSESKLMENKGVVHFVHLKPSLPTLGLWCSPSVTDLVPCHPPRLLLNITYIENPFLTTILKVLVFSATGLHCFLPKYSRLNAYVVHMDYCLSPPQGFTLQENRDYGLLIVWFAHCSVPIPSIGHDTWKALSRWY